MKGASRPDLRVGDPGQHTEHSVRHSRLSPSPLVSTGKNDTWPIRRDGIGHDQQELYLGNVTHVG